ncbi:DUF5812 family protein [Halogeometricum sp. S1BR25-6]|uniref:DUF5812 family protein n=1 Tax=Halogeometricum salsisoli TaxID=2950536 RepID=A0ABU2GHV2_9EURY|nr:DUF5812 family protein [Halogeometricum sp. S1BR25-6]MDS0299863.1 DUF5812 family protein [Halogeometricum sp. S1BR25-6]
MTEDDGVGRDEPFGDAGPSDGDDERVEGTFLVTAADKDSAVLKNVDTGQVHTLSSNPGVERHDAVTGVVAPDPPMNVSYQLVDIESRWGLTIELSDESPTADSRDVAASQPTGELTQKERAGTGEIHVITVPEEETEQAATDVADDAENTLSRAARLGVNRVEIRTAPGVVVVRYMP